MFRYGKIECENISTQTAVLTKNGKWRTALLFIQNYLFYYIPFFVYAPPAKCIWVSKRSILLYLTSMNCWICLRTFFWLHRNYSIYFCSCEFWLFLGIYRNIDTVTACDNWPDYRLRLKNNSKILIRKLIKLWLVKQKSYLETSGVLSKFVQVYFLRSRNIKYKSVFKVFWIFALKFVNIFLYSVLSISTYGIQFSLVLTDMKTAP